MKQYFLKTAGALALAFVAAGAFAQEDSKESSHQTTTVHRSDDVIIIRPKTNVDTKINIEIKGGDVMVNGKPLADYKSDDVSISKRKQMQLEVENGRLAELQAAPRTRFRSGANAFGYGSSDNLTITTNSNKAFLGVGTEKNEEGEGVTVTSVSDESAAEKAGLKEGDIITKLNDVKVNTPEELTKAIGKFNPDEKVTVTYKRDKKEQKTTAVLTKRKNSSFTLNAPYETYKNFNFNNNNNFNFSWGKPRLGLKAQETEDGKGLKVLDVDDESAAEKAGIKEGDIITTFDGTEVNNIDKLRELSKSAIEKGTFMVKLTRDGKLQELQVKIPKDLKTGSL